MTLKIYIYRDKYRKQGWSLEVVAEDGASTIWDKLFKTDEEALDETLVTIKKIALDHF